MLYLCSCLLPFHHLHSFASWLGGLCSRFSFLIRTLLYKSVTSRFSSSQPWIAVWRKPSVFTVQFVNRRYEHMWPTCWKGCQCPRYRSWDKIDLKLIWDLESILSQYRSFGRWYPFEKAGDIYRIEFWNHQAFAFIIIWCVAGTYARSFSRLHFHCIFCQSNTELGSPRHVI